MNKLIYHLLVIFLVVSFLFAGPSLDTYASPLAAPTHINLGVAEIFAVLAGAGITNTGATTISGDAGSSPTSTQTGFGTVTFLSGINHTAPDPNDATTVTAKVDLGTAYNNAVAQLPQTAIPGGTLGGGQTLISGIYNSGSSIQLNGNLILDGQGDPDAVFVFQAGSTLTTASASRVLFTNGANPCNVYWQVGSSATLGTGTNFAGTIMAAISITDNGGSTVDGRLLARTGAVALNNTTIAAPFCDLTISKAFSPTTIIAGGPVSTLTITFSNVNNTSAATLTSDFTDNLPAGVEIAAVPNISTTCGGAGTLTAIPGTSIVTMSTGYIIPGIGTCKLLVDVSTPLPGSFINTIPVGALITDIGSNINPASATLISINPALVSPTITTSLSAASVTVGSNVVDSATLHGATATAGGTVIYSYYSDSACSLNIQPAGTVTVTNAIVPDSSSILFNVAGTYYWQAVYSGDAANNGAVSACTSEILVVNKAVPTLTTAASGPVVLGADIWDTAYLAGGFGLLTGHLTFEVFAPGDTTCATPIIVAPWVVVNGVGTYPSAHYTSLLVGTYRWIAHYSGDANNTALTTACNDPAESSTVTGTTPTPLPPVPTPLPPVLPGTGFTPQRVTVLPAQPEEKAYSDLGDLWLEIPSLGVEIPIKGVPVSANTWDVTWLSNQAGWLEGSAFPTRAGNSVLTAHVYDANGNLGPFGNLNSLVYGDRIIVHAWGQQYVYEVRSISTITPNSVSSVIKHEDLPWLTLLTCKGYVEATNSYANRFLVRAVQIEIN